MPKSNLYREPVLVYSTIDLKTKTGAVKHALGKLSLPELIERFLVEQWEQHGIVMLPLDEQALLHLHKLPALHGDPFDRMLIGQAIEHDCVLLTPDPLIAQYLVRTQW